MAQQPYSSAHHFRQMCIVACGGKINFTRGNSEIYTWSYSFIRTALGLPGAVILFLVVVWCAAMCAVQEIVVRSETAVNIIYLHRLRSSFVRKRILYSCCEKSVFVTSCFAWPTNIYYKNYTSIKTKII